MQHKELGLTGPQFHMLMLIHKEGTCNISYLADTLGVKPSAITVMIDRLVQSGYVSRRHDEEDRRTVLVSVTDEGNEILGKARIKSRSIMKWYLSQLDERDLEVMAGIFEKLSTMGKPPGLNK
ncbi:MarR family transcriptional regulator [Paenibacillus sp. CAA11]|nr:MarR family transcriptional regulator [Paenibacillus sp. CAA11]